jgi:ornithine cyclodeaminase/alanine dehydrogenase-like protein (mu-crystallin family)
MSRDVLLLRESDIRDLLDPAACLDAVQQALAAYSTGQAQIPAVIALDVAENHGEIHMKAGHLRGGPYYAVKIISGFWDNPQLGLPALNGMVVVFDAKTGAPAGFLVDNGFITDLRTGAAGAVAAKYLARKDIGIVAVVGSGAQARRQVEMLALVRKFSAVRIWGRDPSKARACADALARNTAIPACPFAVTDSVRQAVGDADLVITVTASCTPLVRAEWLKPGVTIIAVGSDGPGKQELDCGVLERAGKIVADSLPQCLRLGEIHHAVRAGARTEEKTCELGEIVAALKPGRTSEDEVIVCDLTGVGVQDVAAASVVMQRAQATGRGERITI